MKGAEERARIEHLERAWLAWHTAYLPHLKRPPKFEQLIGEPRRTRKPPPWQEQLARWQAYAAVKGR